MRGDEDGEEGSDEDEDEQGSEDDEVPPERMAVPAPPIVKAKAIDRATPGISQDPIWGDQMDVDPAASTIEASPSGDHTGINPDRYVASHCNFFGGEDRHP